jgi:acetyl esterase/lipase
MKIPALCWIVLLLVPAAAAAAELSVGDAQVRTELGRDCPVVYLWPEGQAPDEPRAIPAEFIQPSKNVPKLLMIQNVTRPSFTVIAPPAEKNTGVALVLGPGGGYGGLGFGAVLDTARVLNERGIAVVLLKYRVPKRHQGFAMNHHALQDAQRAVGILRARGAEWGIAPNKIGIGGFSAGGHLAASLTNNFEPRLYPAVDDYDRTSCRPDFAVLLCPAYLTEPMLSRTPDPGLHYDQISVAKTPPTFIAITMPDKFTIGSVEYSLALGRAKVNNELHVYPTHGHSNGVAERWLTEWARECHRWLGDAGFLGERAKPAPLAYRAATLPATPAPAGLTEGDWKLRQILGRDCPVILLWGEGQGPDETLPAGTAEVTSHNSRGGSALNITQVVRPTLTVVTPPAGKNRGRAIIIAPGGGYGGLAAEHEGTRVAQWLNEQGITGIVLKYRVPARDAADKEHHAQQDLQRAVRIVRSRAAEFGLDPKKIGVCGFSAGGHACMLLAATFAQDAYPARDAIDRVSCRPDFALPIYPAYLTNPIDSDHVVAKLKAGLKRNVTPPLFFAVARDDRFARGLMNFYLDVREAHVPAECHVYAAGGHGGGIDPISHPTSEWTHAALRWLQELDQPSSN